MKTLAILFAAVSLTLAACATDDASTDTGKRGLRPGYKPELGDSISQDRLPDDGTDIDEAADDAASSTQDVRGELLDHPLDGRAGEWAEDILLDGRAATILHLGDGRIALLDADGNTIRR